VDRFNDFSVSAYAGAGDVRMMMLHRSTTEESIRLFFQDVYHMLVKILMNPFYRKGSRIVDLRLERAIKEVARLRLVPNGVYYYQHELIRLYALVVKYGGFFNLGETKNGGQSPETTQPHKSISGVNPVYATNDGLLPTCSI
jgi:hypothetical protein